MVLATSVLGLLETKGLGRASAARALPLLSSDPDERSLLDALKEAKAQGLLRALPDAKDLRAGLARAEEIVQACEREQVGVLAWDDTRFPVRLKTIPDPPLVLFVKGNARRLDAPFAVAVVGTRDPSERGLDLARGCARVAAQRHVTVVSGLAKGCDAAAHEGALEGGGTTLAVLGHGLHMVYPAAHRKLSEEILASGGCLLSEYAPGEPVRPHQLVERDRIQSGLSDWVVVVETDVEGGTMKTARFATEQRRRLLALRHPPLMAPHAKTRGNQLLLSQGTADPLEGPDELERLLWGLVPSRRPVQPSAPPPAAGPPAPPPAAPKARKGKAPKKPKAPPTTLSSFAAGPAGSGDPSPADPATDRRA